MEEVRLTQAQATKLRETIQKTATGLCRNSIELAEMLYRIKYAVVRIGRGDVGLVQAWGHDSFNTYVEKELRYHYGTANAYVRVYQVLFIFCEGIFTKDELAEVGITNLRRISKVSTPQSIKYWVKQAKTKTCCQLEEMVERERIGSSRVVAVKTFTTTVRASKIKQLQRDLEKLCAVYGVESRGEALVLAVNQVCKVESMKPQLRKAG